MGALCQKEAAQDVATPSARTLHVILVYSNPQGFASRRRLLLQTHRHLLALQAALHGRDKLEIAVAQIAYDSLDFVSLDVPGQYDLNLRTPSVNAIWSKENLINLSVRNILQRTAHCAEFFAYVDADITFESPHVVTDTLDRLHPHAMLQLFETATLENPTPVVVKGFGYQYHMNNKLASALKNVSNDHEEYWHPGFAWALHRDVFLATGGLIERSYGSADRHMAMAILGRAQDSIPSNYTVAPAYSQMILDWQAVATEYGVQLGYVPGSIFHSWHGSLVNRQYMGRWQTLTKHQFDPFEHLHVSPETGLLEWSAAASCALRDEVAAYFSNRDEDEPMPTAGQAPTDMPKKTKKKKQSSSDSMTNDSSDIALSVPQHRGSSSSSSSSSSSDDETGHHHHHHEEHHHGHHHHDSHHSNGDQGQCHDDNVSSFPSVYAGGC